MRDLTKMNVTKALLIVALPAMLSSLLQFSYNIIDMYFLGQFDRSGAIIASIGSASLYINFAMGINFLSVLGSGITTSQALGRKDEKEFKEYVATGLSLNVILAFIINLILFVFAPIFIGILNLGDVDITKNAILYLRIYSISLFFNFINSFFTRIMSSMGISNVSLKINGIGILLNIILDPILIFIFNLGLVGACVATIASNFIVTLIFAYRYRDIFNYDKDKIKKAKINKILDLSYPYVIQRIIFGIVGIIMGKIMIFSGDSSAIAGQRLGLQIESVTLMVVGGLFASVSAYTGQNYGAKEYVRIKQGFNRALEIGIVYSFFTGFIFIVFGKELIGLFTDDAQTIYYGTTYIKLVAITQMFAVFEMVGNGLYNGISMPKVPTVISVTITPLRIIFALMLLPRFGAVGVFIGIILTTVIKGCISYGYYLLKVRPRLNKEYLL